MEAKIYRKVKSIKNKWGTNDPFKICKYLNIHIYYKELGDIKGCYKKILNKKIIIINQNLNEKDRKIICAHELGHCLFHSTRDIKFMLEHGKMAKKSKYEKEANLFAKELLLENNESYSFELYFLEK